MLYQSANDWHAASHKNVMLFGMSGLGKTHLSNMLRAQGGWFHYSIDYRIGTRYMGEHIADSFKRDNEGALFARSTVNRLDLHRL